MAANEAARRQRRSQRRTAAIGFGVDAYHVHRQRGKAQQAQADAQQKAARAAWDAMLDARAEFSVAVSEAFCDQIERFEADVVSEVAATEAGHRHGDRFSAEQFEELRLAITASRQAWLEANGPICEAEADRRRQWLAGPDGDTGEAGPGLLGRAAAERAGIAERFAGEYDHLYQASARAVPALFTEVTVGTAGPLAELVGADHVAAGTWVLSWAAYPQRTVRDVFSAVLPRFDATVDGLRANIGARLVGEAVMAWPALFVTDGAGMHWRLRLETHPGTDLIRPLCRHGYPHPELVAGVGDLVGHDAASLNANCPLCTQETYIYPAAAGRPPGPGWLADPFGAHELRWWDGGSWTDLVNDHGVAGCSVIPGPWLPSLRDPGLVDWI